MISYGKYTTSLDSGATSTSEEAPVSARTRLMQAPLGLSNVGAVVLVVVVQSDQ